MDNRDTDQGPEHDGRTVEQIRKSRNIVLGLSLAGFVILVFFISIAKMG